MSQNSQHKTVQEFIDYWKTRGDEKQETQKFWLDLLQNILHIPDAINSTEFEHPTAGGGFVDVLCPEARFLVEQKSSDINLDKPEERQKVKVTPIQQALRYADALPFSLKPAVLCTCNFHEFRFYDLEKDPRATGEPADRFTLDELGDHLATLESVFSVEHSRLTVQQKISETAGLLVANLHNALAKQYENPDDPIAHHSLAVLTVRIVFCLYAEDANLFPINSFSEYVQANDTAHLRRALIDLFDTLNTPKPDRDKYLEENLKRFDYVNGGLFAEHIEIPPFTDEIREAMLHASEHFNWKDISPVIFGSLMEETLSHDQRRQGGMHYTTVKNIHRLIDPLFLDGLRDELRAIETDDTIGERARRNRLKAYQNKLASLRFLDPACGSGNFLTETFLRLRELENQTIADLLHGQGYIDFGGDESLVKVHIDQFYGIEINDFAVSVSKTALWIAEQQALDDTEAIAEQTLPHLPLHDSGNIIQANAVRYDWNQLLPGSECNYIIGNPPFIGQKQRTPDQKIDLQTVWGTPSIGLLDYVTCWYRKAADYFKKELNGRFAFVSTNSITQGDQVKQLFSPLFDEGWEILFAHKSFEWDAQSTDNASVHVVIIGMGKRSNTKPVIFEYETVNSEPHLMMAKNINGYLIDGPDVFIDKRRKPLSPILPSVSRGYQTTDNGTLTFDDPDTYALAMSDTIAAKYVRPFKNGKEMINNENRWCLKLDDAPASDILKSPFLKSRVEACRSYREAQGGKPSSDAYKLRKTPQLFRPIPWVPDSRYLAIPVVFSGLRRYATCGWLDETVVPGVHLFIVSDPTAFAFSVVESSMFMTWQKAVGGRTKSDCNFSNTIVWNNLPLPPISDAVRTEIIEAGKRIISIRSKYAGESLAELYSPMMMHPDLIKAHEQLDRIVDVAFGAKHWLKDDDDARLQVLFDSYARMTGGR